MNKDFLKSSSSLIGTIIGAGIFGVPFVMAQAGFFIGVSYFLVLGTIMLILHLMYAEVVEHTGEQHRLIGYSKIYFGKRAKEFVSVSVIVSLFGSLIVYILLANEFLSTVLSNNFLGKFTWGFLFWAILSVGILKGIKIITKAEVFMMGFLILVVSLIVFKGVPLIDIQNYSNVNLAMAFLPYGVILFSLGGFNAVPEIYFSMKNPDSRIFRKSIITGVVASAAITLLFATVVVGISGSLTSPDAIEGLLPYLGKQIIYLGSIFGVLAVATSYLIIGSNLRNSFIYDWNMKSRWSSLLVVATPILLIFAGVKNFIVTLGFVGAILGAINGSVTALLFLKARKVGVKMIHLPIKFPKTLAGSIVFVLIGGGIYVIFNLITS